MCRWLAYSGPPIFLDSLVFEPQNSLISQSMHALQGRTATNGDGFGIGWYGERGEPGVYRDVRPAWNDENLRSLARQIRARHFLAHVRAATGAAITWENCHPFRHGQWLFMHNGQIGGFAALRRELTFRIAPELFTCLRGTTDSEVFFYLLLTFGAADDPIGAYRRTIAEVLTVMAAHGVEGGIHMTAALSDGETTYALRYASDGQAPTLYYSCGANPASAQGQKLGCTGNSVLILSEPLDHTAEQWQEVPQSHVLIAGDGAAALAPFELTA
jgi:glutamine amidotransferase